MTHQPSSAHTPLGPRLTVGMATYDDYDGVFFTVQSLVLNHPEIAASLEILVVDNHPEGPAASALQSLAEAVPGARYLAFTEIRSTAVRDVIFREARAPTVLCIDSHVLLPPGALLRLVEYFEARPDCLDLIQGPLLYDDHRSLSTHFDPVWSAGMYGVWATDTRGLDTEAPPFEIPMQGLGLFACHARAWPGLNPRFRGFGGEEGYLHEKFRQRGGHVLCLPFLRWLHRFQRPGGVPFGNTWEDRIRNYLIGHQELGLATDDLEAHFRSFVGDQVYQHAEAETRAEMANPWWAFDGIYAIGLDDADDVDFSRDGIQRRFSATCKETGLTKLLRYHEPATDVVAPPELRTALNHRRLVERALNLGFDTVLLIDARIAQLTWLQEVLQQATSALQAGHNAVLIHDPTLEPTSSIPFQQSETAVPRTETTVPHLGPPWAIAYSQRGSRQICENLPHEPEALAARLQQHGGSLQHYLESLQAIVSIP